MPAATLFSVKQTVSPWTGVPPFESVADKLVVEPYVPEDVDTYRLVDTRSVLACWNARKTPLA
jgi:hypothetical protein